jgi:putative ABC transport system permease protein
VVVLLIVCANITHLQLVRGTRLRREVTIRTALGATRSALTRRAALEVLLLAMIGCFAGILIALPALRLLIAVAPQEIPRLADVRLNRDVVAFSVVVSLLVMAVTALLPLWRSWQVDPAAAMKQDAARGLESKSSGRLRQALIAGEVALTLTLSVAAVLLVRQLIAQSKQDLGFLPDHLLMLDTHMVGVPNGPSDVALLNRMVESVGSVPGVFSAAAVSSAPMAASNSDVSYAIHGVSEFKPGNYNMPDANIMGMTPGYLRTMGIPLLKGRDITPADRAGSELVMVISESVVKQSFRGVDPIGKQIMTGWDDVGGWDTIIGVAGDVRQESPASVPYPTFYLPVAQHPRSATDMQLLVRTRIDAGAMALTLTNVMKKSFPQASVEATTMRESVGESERAQHFRTLLFGSFAGVSILLAMTGIYGVTAYTVAQKRFEFGLRFALGAQRGQVLGSVLRGALAITVIGITSGFALSVGLMRVESNLLGQMPSFDAVSYAVATGVVLLIALAATLLPAYRAASVEPMQVLRDE